MSSSKLTRSGPVVYLSATDAEYYTPGWLREAVHRRWRLPDVDPCTSLRNPMGARIFECKDGLRLLDELIAARVPGRDVARAQGDPFVWCNPPYGRGIAEWITRLAMLATSIPRCNVLGFVPARPGAGWYAAATDPGVLMACQAFCELRSRITYEKGDGTEHPFPARWASVLLYWGPERRNFSRWASRLGVVRLVRERPPVRRGASQDSRQLKLV